LVVTVPAVAVNTAEVEPAGMVTEAATGSVVLLLDRDTTVPPLGAASATVMVHVVLAAVVRLVGEHWTEDKPGSQFVTEIAPEFADSVSADPFANVAIGLLIVMGTVAVLVAGDKLTIAVAITPLPMVESVDPTTTHLTEPPAELHVRVFPSLLSADPAATTTELTSPGANEYVHSTPAGAVPLSLNERLSATEPPSAAEPEERLIEDV